MNSFKVFAKSLSNLVHEFWEDFFHKPQLLLAANRLIYFNIFIYLFIYLFFIYLKVDKHQMQLCTLKNSY